MQNHACSISMGRQKSTQKHPFACEDACWYLDAFAFPIQLMELWFPRQGAGQSLPGLLLCRCELHSGKK